MHAYWKMVNNFLYIRKIEFVKLMNTSDILRSTLTKIMLPKIERGEWTKDIFIHM